ncbi:glycosyltransferase family 4 protein [Burkholderia cepacia]
MKSEIYLVTPWFGTFAGGGEATFRALSKKFKACGIDVTVLTTTSKSPYLDWHKDAHPAGESVVDGTRTIRFEVDQRNQDDFHLAVRKRLDGLPVERHLQDAFFTLGMNSQKLIDFASKLPKHVPILAGHYYQALAPSLINALPDRISFMPAFHDEPEFYWSPIEASVKRARHLLYLSQEEKRLTIAAHGRTGGRKVVEAPVVGLGVELPVSLESREKMKVMRLSVAEKFKLPGRYFIYVGRIEEGKGLSYLLPWYEEWSAQREAVGLPTIPLVLVGAGNMEIVPKSKHFISAGYVSLEEKFAIASGAVALINPSVMESFSYVVMESWLVGRPVVVPRQCAVTSGHCDRSGGGEVFADQAQFEAALNKLTQSDVADVLGEAGRKFVNQEYGWPVVMNRLLHAMELA